MKKSFKISISFLVISAMSLYLAHIDKTIYPTLNDYIEAHLNNPQQYLYIVTIYAMCVLWAIFIPFLEPCFYLRYTNVIEKINKRNLCYSLIFGPATFFIYIFTAVLTGYSADFNVSYILIIGKLILYYFMCFELSTAIYLLFKKMILSILSLYLINIAVISIYYTVNFCICSNTISKHVYHQVFYIYILVLAILCLLFNELYLKRKEII